MHYQGRQADSDVEEHMENREEGMYHQQADLCMDEHIHAGDLGHSNTYGEGEPDDGDYGDDAGDEMNEDAGNIWSSAVTTPREPVPFRPISIPPPNPAPTMSPNHTPTVSRDRASANPVLPTTSNPATRTPGPTVCF